MNFKRCFVAVFHLFTLGLLASTYGDYLDPHCDGKQVIVEMFEWKYKDVARECEIFLSKKGYCGVQVSPASENAVIQPRHWWERYQPVSYKLSTRSGNETDFVDMVKRCTKVGVQVYPDIIINHMAGLGRHGNGTGGTPFDTRKSSFSIPGVPYNITNFNFNQRGKCPSGDGNVNAYQDPRNVRNCNLEGLSDLDQGQAYVREKIIEYMNHLIDLGVAGFRLDTAKHMWPGDLKYIWSQLKNVKKGGKPFFVQEVIDKDDGAVRVNEYYETGRVTEFRFSQKMFWGASDFNQFNSAYDSGWKMADPAHAFVFVDNHDLQRGHAGGSDYLTYKRPTEYVRAQAFAMAYNYGFVRVMSGYKFTDTEAGPPMNADQTIKDVVIRPDGSCENGWVCEHRWQAIASMPQFRNKVAGSDLRHWYNNGGVVAFGRGGKGFFAMGKNSFNQNFQTGMPAGEYCDLISACAMKVTVDASGNANIHPHDGNNIVAFITDGNTTHGTEYTAPTLKPIHVTYPPGTYKRTVILIEKQTFPGQELFVRGGIDSSHRAGCTGSSNITSNACAIPIKHRIGGPASFKAWAKGDRYLDWGGSESGQGDYYGKKAQGTPAYWTTNDKTNPNYASINQYGAHYWLIDVDMDCNRTENSFFEFKALVNGNWEGNSLGVPCTGPDAAAVPYTSNNHFARCGYLNVFHYNQKRCEIKHF